MYECLIETLIAKRKENSCWAQTERKWLDYSSRIKAYYSGIHLVGRMVLFER